jgi:cytochrome c peroxidase
VGKTTLIGSGAALVALLTIATTGWGETPSAKPSAASRTDAAVPAGGAPSAKAAGAAAASGAGKGEVLRSGSWSMTLPLGLQAGSAYVPDDNPITAEKIALGRFLYFDKRLSKDMTISCASCHNPFHGFADPAPTSSGVSQKLGGRNSPTVINRLFSSEQFWDGRAQDLEFQSHGPLTNPVEMAMGSHDEVVGRVKAVQGYPPLFAKAFGDDKVDLDRIGKAIASYERTIVAGDSPYDRYQAGDKDALGASAVRGMALFNGKANCKACHTGFNFTDETYQDIGVGMDLGRYDTTKNDGDRGKFKTPTLRNVTQTAPYMHDGSEETLMQVVEFYDRGGIANPNLSKEIKPLKLSAQEKRDLVAFLESLTGAVENTTPPETLPR